MSEIRKSILIIKSKPKSLVAVETFLKNREWAIRSTVNTKEAIQAMLKQKPSFVLIALDHPDKKIRALPKVLAQAFPVFMIGYVEQNNGDSFRFLRESNLTYKINPPITGPAVERTVNKILKDQEKAQDTSTRSNATAGLAAADNVHIKSGGANSNGGTYTISQGGGAPAASFVSGGAPTGDSNSVSSAEAESASRILQALAGLGEDPGDSMSSEEAAALGGSEGGPKGNMAYMPTGQADALGSSQGGAGGPLYRPGENPEGSANDPNAPARMGSTDANSVTTQDGAPLGAPLGAVMPGAESAAAPALGTAAPLSALRDDDEHKTDEAGIAASLAAFEKNKKKDQDGKEAEAGEVTPVSMNIRRDQLVVHGHEETRTIINRIAQEALENSVTPTPKESAKAVENVTHMMCFVVKSTRFTGYLLSALARNEKFQEKFASVLQAELRKLFEKYGEPIEERNQLNLKIRQVQLESWAQEYAEFLCKSVHDGQEVAMVFIRDEEGEPEVKDSARTDMASIRLNDLAADEIVPFNMYIYLPTNDKYVLYTNKGSKFFGDQKERLMKQGLAHMHIKKTELNEFNAYQVEKQINSKVDEFHQKQKSKKAS